VVVLNHIKILHSWFLTLDWNFVIFFIIFRSFKSLILKFHLHLSVNKIQLYSNYCYTKLHLMRAKEIALQLCTCTWLEIMTCIGVTLYLLHNSEYNLAVITIAVFSPLVGFHFAISKISNDDYCVTCRESNQDLLKFHIRKNNKNQ
jgi:hypothetical protein